MSDATYPRAAFPIPPAALTCPRCSAPAHTSNAVQTCSICKKSFVLRAGTRLDSAIVPLAVDSRAKRIKTRASAGILMRSNELVPDAIVQGTLDPIIGMIAMEQDGIPYADIYTIAVWRTISILRVVLAAVVMLPLTVALLMFSYYAPPVLIVAVPTTLTLVFVVYTSLVTRQNHARIVGGLRTMNVQFDSPFFRRIRFHDELLRRSGIAPGPIP